MTSCKIIISHFESVNFLHACIRQIRKCVHPEIESTIIVADQSRDLWHNNIVNQYWGDDDITVVKMPPLYSGFGVDFIMRHVDIKTEYVAQIHVDVLAISKQWLLLPITLIEENNFSFVGQLHFISKPTDTIYPPIPFFSMSPTFNVAKTETYKEMSLEAGFTRYHNRPQSGLTFLNNDWEVWAAEDYQARGSDDDVVAFAWESNYRDTDKLGLAITGVMDTFDGGSFGRIIEDVVFHFGSCRESIGVFEQMGDSYRNWTKKINNGFSEKLIQEMVTLAISNPQPYNHISGAHERSLWDGKTKTVSMPPESLNKRIEELKK